MLNKLIFLQPPLKVGGEGGRGDAQFVVLAKRKKGGEEERQDGQMLGSHKFFCVKMREQGENKVVSSC